MRATPVTPVLRRTPLRLAVLIGAALMLLMTTLVPAFASHPEVSLPISDFEIDTDANTQQDDPDPSIDWLTANTTSPPIVVEDEPTGQNDDSFGQGTKEDTEVPTITDGGIPPNKSDLLEFGVYQEDAGTAGVLNLFWSRVQDPSGTTNMDFEFNKNKCVIEGGQPTDDSNCSGNGVTPLRIAGDLLLVYELSKGGTVPELFLLTWLDGTETPPATAADCDSSNSLPCWGNREDLDASGQAAGSINTSEVPQGTTEGGDVLGPYGPRTFGEAQIDLDAIFDPDACESFGSAYLKSRSSDSFTAALKDFIAPEPVDINNCAQVIIRKQTDPDGASGTFEFDKTFNTDPSTPNDFTLQDDGVQDYGKTVLIDTGLMVSEDLTTLPSGFELVDINCSASTGVTPTIDLANGKVTFDLDSDDDVLDCTFTNRIRGQVNILKTDDAEPPAPLAGVEFELYTDNPPLDGDPPAGPEDTATGQTCTTAADGTCSITDVAPGQYWVVENVSTLPAGYDPAPDQNVVIDADNLTVSLTFVDPRQAGAILITKTRKHAAASSDTDPHAGVDFTVTGGELATEGVLVTTDANGEACVDGLVLSDFVGDYTVTESVPTGYVADGATAKTVTVTTASTCGDGNEAGVGFANTPLTNVTVSVDSQVDGGTASTIVCTDSDGNVSNGSTGTGGDGSLTVNDLSPTDPAVTLTCQITVDP